MKPPTTPSSTSTTVTPTPSTQATQHESPHEQQHPIPSGWFIAVHAGAGYHSPDSHSHYKQAMKRACLAAASELDKGKSAFDAVTVAISVLEDNPITNAGLGSNLTEDGTVECDASIMDGSDSAFAAVGAVPGVHNPIQLAARLIQEERKGLLSLGRIPPIFLTGRGAWKWAKKSNMLCANSEDILDEYLVTNHTRDQWKDYMNRLRAYERHMDQQENESYSLANNENAHDTVGAICMDRYGNVSAGVSSGGIALKHSGRVGEAAVYGCGCWAENGSSSAPSCASSCSGTGEDIMRCMLAKECVELLKDHDYSDDALRELLDERFIARHQDKKYAGVISMRRDVDADNLDFSWAYTTHSFAVGYMSSAMKQPKTMISTAESTASVGKRATIEVTKVILCSRPSL